MSHPAVRDVTDRMCRLTHNTSVFEYSFGLGVTILRPAGLRLGPVSPTMLLHPKLAVVLMVAVVASLLLLLFVPSGKAIPAFSRKYQTSCTTCHNLYPELNDFGWAFKKNGFKFPKDDDTFVKQEPVLLGSKAQKEAFPEAVYPGEIPGTIPIAFRYEGNFIWNAYQPQPAQATGYVPRTDLFVPNTFTIIAAGSFGENLSFWIDDDI